MKKLLCVLLASLMLPGFAVCAFAAQSEGFVPVFRFVAASDTHVKSNDDTNARRIPKMMELAYSIAGADPAYTGLDALLIAGDLTNDGTKEEFDLFWQAVSSSLREGTRFLGVAAKNHDGYVMKRKEVHAYYTSLTGNQADFHTVIGGYHFIGLSASDNDALHYDAGQLLWLKKQLDEATAEDPAKPVFVMHHEHPRGTVYGSSLYDGWGVPYFGAILKQYPQVVDFSGHSHYPINDPRSVWQGKYTAVGTGAIYYSEFTIDEMRAYDPPDCRETATCWLVELDKDNNMRLRGYDVNEGKQLCEVYLENPAKPENRDFTPVKRKKASAAPVFPEGAALTAEPFKGGCTVTAPLAQGTADDPVVLYRIKVKDKLGVTVDTQWVLPTYYRAIEQQPITFTVEGLADKAYTFSVVAENAYGKQSKPLVLKNVTIEGENVFRNIFTRIRLFFDRIELFFSQLF